jgi:hypothetical protein
MAGSSAGRCDGRAGAGAAADPVRGAAGIRSRRQQRWRRPGPRPCDSGKRSWRARRRTQPPPAPGGACNVPAVGYRIQARTVERSSVTFHVRIALSVAGADQGLAVQAERYGLIGPRRAPACGGWSARGEGGGAFLAEFGWWRVGLAGQGAGPPHPPADAEVERGDQHGADDDGVEQDAEGDREAELGQNVDGSVASTANVAASTQPTEVITPPVAARPVIAPCRASRCSHRRGDRSRPVPGGARVGLAPARQPRRRRGQRRPAHRKRLPRGRPGQRKSATRLRRRRRPRDLDRLARWCLAEPVLLGESPDVPTAL